MVLSLSEKDSVSLGSYCPFLIPLTISLLLCVNGIKNRSMPVFKPTLSRVHLHQVPRNVILCYLSKPWIHPTQSQQRPIKYSLSAPKINPAPWSTAYLSQFLIPPSKFKTCSYPFVFRN